MSASILALSLLVLLNAPARDGQSTDFKSPESAVLCDRYVCANSTGISRELTEKYLGKATAARVFAQGDFDRTEFTFANGIFCDVKERLCREDRYYGVDGKRSGAVSEKYTHLLFPPKPSQ